MTTLAVFPGQGSQKVGMGLELSNKFKSAKKVFEEVDDALSFKLSSVMFEGDEETLKLTENAQPALMATGVAVGQGSMVAFLGVSIEDIEHFIALVDSSNGLVEIANDNAPGQVVVSGNLETLELLIKLARESGIRKIIRLSVSAPFHCSLMKSAAENMKIALEDVKLQEPSFPIICNVTSIPETSTQKIKNNLILQITRRVRWRETMASLSRLGISQIVEMGTGKVLTGLAKRGASELNSLNLEMAEDILQWLKLEKLL
jgi:[acyl-carrier-protein] S-malonyltransferase